MLGDNRPAYVVDLEANSGHRCGRSGGRKLGHGDLGSMLVAADGMAVICLLLGLLVCFGRDAYRWRRINLNCMLAR